MKHAAALLALSLIVAGCATTSSEQPDQAKATASLSPTAGNQAVGTVRFIPRGDDVLVVAQVAGLKPNSEHGFHVHEKGDCSKPDATSAGGHFNPYGKSHGRHDATPRHLGDMPNLMADASGKAVLEYTLSGVRLEGGSGLIGRGIIVHAGPDDYASQPAGNSGPRVACGVIKKS